MSEKNSLIKRISWLSVNQCPSELESFVDSLPQAALLADSQSWLVSHPNPKFLSTTGYTFTELIGSKALSLFSDGCDEDLKTPPSTLPELKWLIHRDQSQTLVRLYVTRLPQTKTKTLLILEPAEDLTAIERQKKQPSIWPNIEALFNSANEPDIFATLKKALAAAREISGSEMQAVYRLSEGKPEIQRLTSLGEDAFLPDLLSMQDLIALNQPKLWVIGKYPSCALHRTVRTAGMRYLASAPIGQDNTIIGLVLIGGRENPPPVHVLELVQLLSTAVGSFLRNDAQLNSFLSQLKEKNLQNLSLTTITERVQEGVMRLTPDLIIQNMNPRLEQSLGYFSKEVAGQNVEKILIGNDKILPALLQAQNGEPVFQLKDVSLFRRDGESFHAQVRIFPILNENRVNEILIFIQDLSEVEKIRTHSQELENRALLGELMAVFAHEVRNPINNISANLQYMEVSLAANASEREAIARMLQDCDRLEELVKSVLAFSKPQDYEMGKLDLGPLLQRLIDRLKSRLANENIKIDLQIDAECPSILGNSRALEQVFNNLMNNATQAMSETGGLLSLKVQSTQTDEGPAIVEVYIADNGPGIAKENQDRIFQPFFTTKHSGTGLGLAIAKRIITAHKGDIRLSSFPGGTIFYIQLPAIYSNVKVI